MEWNVFYHDGNRQKITTFNIFKHNSFAKDIKTDLKESKDKQEFKTKLKSNLMYYFWSKAEYEIIISPWVGGRDTKELKVDVYTQVMNNFDIFLDYVWSKKNV